MINLQFIRDIPIIKEVDIVDLITIIMKSKLELIIKMDVRVAFIIKMEVVKFEVVCWVIKLKVKYQVVVYIVVITPIISFVNLPQSCPFN